MGGVPLIQQFPQRLYVRFQSLDDALGTGGNGSS